MFDNPARLDGVPPIGVDEHAWRHTTHRNKHLTVIIDLTPVRKQTGPARLLNMVERRSKCVFKGSHAVRPKAWAKRIEVAAMDTFTGFKTAAAEKLPKVVAAMDPFHIVYLAGERLDDCRHRVQLTLHTGASLLTNRQRQRLETLFTTDVHIEVKAV